MEQEAAKSRSQVEDILCQIASSDDLPVTITASSFEGLRSSLQANPNFLRLKFHTDAAVVALQAKITSATGESELVPLVYAAGVLQDQRLLPAIAKHLQIVRDSPNSYAAAMIVWASNELASAEKKRASALELLNEFRN
jgi:hypothetical protein